jgi:hypothetical protein
LTLVWLRWLASVAAVVAVVMAAGDVVAAVVVAEVGSADAGRGFWRKRQL